MGTFSEQMSQIASTAAGKLQPAQCCCLKAPASARCLPVFLSYSIVYVKDQVLAPFVLTGIENSVVRYLVHVLSSSRLYHTQCRSEKSRRSLQYSPLFFHRAASLAIFVRKMGVASSRLYCCSPLSPDGIFVNPVVSKPSQKHNLHKAWIVSWRPFLAHPPPAL